MRRTAKCRAICGSLKCGTSSYQHSILHDIEENNIFYDCSAVSLLNIVIYIMKKGIVSDTKTRKILPMSPIVTARMYRWRCGQQVMMTAGDSSWTGQGAGIKTIPGFPTPGKVEWNIKNTNNCTWTLLKINIHTFFCNDNQSLNKKK